VANAEDLELNRRARFGVRGSEFGVLSSVSGLYILTPDFCLLTSVFFFLSGA